MIKIQCILVSNAFSIKKEHFFAVSGQLPVNHSIMYKLMLYSLVFNRDESSRRIEVDCAVEPPVCNVKVEDSR